MIACLVTIVVIPYESTATIVKHNPSNVRTYEATLKREFDLEEKKFIWNKSFLGVRSIDHNSHWSILQERDVAAATRFLAYHQ